MFKIYHLVRKLKLSCHWTLCICCKCKVSFWVQCCKRILWFSIGLAHYLLNMLYQPRIGMRKATGQIISQGPYMAHNTLWMSRKIMIYWTVHFNAIKLWKFFGSQSQFHSVLRPPVQRVLPLIQLLSLKIVCWGWNCPPVNTLGKLTIFLLNCY